MPDKIVEEIAIKVPCGVKLGRALMVGASILMALYLLSTVVGTVCEDQS